MPTSRMLMPSTTRLETTQPINNHAISVEILAVDTAVTLDNGVVWLMVTVDVATIEVVLE